MYPIDVLLSRAFLADVYPIDMHLIDVHPTGRTDSSDVNMVGPLLPESLVAGDIRNLSGVNHGVFRKCSSPNCQDQAW